jgi:3',5'-cyclic-AMP phosphodiesterase
MGTTFNASPLLVVQISDLHLFKDERQNLLGWNTWGSFKQIVQQLDAYRPRPDLILLTGDLSQDETAASYQKIVECLIPLEIPTYWLPGNHDHVLTMQQVLDRPPVYADKSLNQGGWQYLLLNTNVPGQVYGALSLDGLAWLERELSIISLEQPTLISMHHPPFWVGSPWLDQSGLNNTTAFFEIIDQYPQVQLVLVGHVHQEFQCVRNDVTYLSTPSTCIQFMPKSPEFALDTNGPGFRLLWLHPDGTFETAVERVGLHQQQLNLNAQGY